MALSSDIKPRRTSDFSQAAKDIRAATERLILDAASGTVAERVAARQHLERCIASLLMATFDG